MKNTSVRYALRGAWRGVAMSPWLHAMALLTVVLCTLLAMSVTLGWRNITEAAEAQHRRAASQPIVVQMTTAGSAAAAELLARDLEGLPEVARIELARADAPVKARARTLEVYVHADTQPEFAQRLAHYLARRAGVVEPGPLTDASSLDVRAIALGLVVFAALAAWLMIGSVLRLTVFARRGEIRVLEMLGATTRFIRAPHMLLGFLHTLLGALVAASLLQVVLVAFAPDWSLLLTRVNNGVAFAPRFFRPEELAVGIGVTVLFGLWTMRAAVAHARRP